MISGYLGRIRKQFPDCRITLVQTNNEGQGKGIVWGIHVFEYDEAGRLEDIYEARGKSLKTLLIEACRGLGI